MVNRPGTPKPLSAKERKLAYHKEKQRQSVLCKEKDKRRGWKPCRWHIYGCPEKIPYPSLDPDSNMHSSTCSFRSCEETHAAWEVVRSYQQRHPTFKPDIWGFLAPKAAQYLPVPKHNPALPLPSDMLPLIFKPNDLWDVKEPPVEEVHEACFIHGFKADMTVTVPPDTSPWTINRQIIWPTHEPLDVAYILNLVPDDLNNTYPMSVPAALEEALGSESTGFIAYNITPRHTFVDIHVDRGQDTVAINLGKTKKIWFLWPPTQKNESLFYNQAFQHVPEEEDGATDIITKPLQATRFVRFAGSLEGGMITNTTNTEAVYIPAGWLHAVLTIEGGYLCGISWTTSKRLPILLRCLKLEVSHLHTIKETKPTAVLVMNVIQIVLESPFIDCITRGMEAWISLNEILESTSENWGGDILKRSKQIMAKLSTRKTPNLPKHCPCGYKGTVMGKHFLSTHVYRPGGASRKSSK